MLLPVERLIGAPLLSLQLEAKIAEATEPIVDPRQLKLVAFYVNSPKPGTLVVMSQDIREVNPGLGLIIDSEDAIVPLDEMIRLKEIIEFNFQLNGLKVVDEHGRKHGRVRSYNIDPKSFFVEQFEVDPGVFRSISTSSNLIHRHQVISVTNQKIIIKAPTAEAENKSANSDFVNPFREARQPESSHFSADHSY